MKNNVMILGFKVVHILQSIPCKERVDFYYHSLLLPYFYFICDPCWLQFHLLKIKKKQEIFVMYLLSKHPFSWLVQIEGYFFCIVLMGGLIAFIHFLGGNGSYFATLK